MTHALLNAPACRSVRSRRPAFAALAAATCGIIPVSLHSAQASDLTTVQQRIESQLIQSAPTTSTVQGYMSTEQSNGSWSDVDYNNTSQTNWLPQTALFRMQDMAEEYWNTGSSLYQNSTLETDVLNAYNYWVSVDPQSTNWYDNAIRTPQGISSTVLLMQPDMTSTQLSQANTIMNRADAELSDPSIAQGSNLVLLATVGINQGIIDNNTSDISQGFNEIQSTVSVVNANSGDGIQPDNSYHFHGNQLYEGDYGVTALEDPLQYASIAVGTSYAMSTAQEDILVNTLLGSSQWFVYGESLAFSASGRDASRQGFDTDGTAYISAIQYALSLGSYQSTALQAFLNRQESASNTGAANPTYGLTGNVVFPDSDAMVQQRPSYFEDVKVTSTRTINPESINGENLKGLYLGDGVNEIMVTGNEYNNIEPVWNWYHLPGTTIEQNGRSLQPGSADTGSTSYAGGVSDGMYGAEALDYSRYNVNALKSWYFFDNEQVALGAAINCPNATSEVDTTLNQCLLTSNVTYETTGGGIQTLTSGTVTPTGLKWVFQGGVGYFFPTPVNNAVISAIAQTGNWQAINSQYSNATVTANVFSLYLNEGSHSSNQSYSYIIVPNTTAAAMDSYYNADPIQMLANNSSVQAIRQSTLGIAQAAFYSPTSLTIATGQTVSVNSPSMLMLKQQTNLLELVGSSPQNLSMSLQAQLSGISLSGATWLNSLGTANVVFNLPGGNSAGDSIGLTLSSDGAANPTVSLANTTGSAPLSYTVTDTVPLASNTTFNTDTNSTLQFSGPITGASSVSTGGAGTIIFAGANSYSGGTNVNSGTLIVNSNSNLGAATGSLSLGTPVPALNGSTTAVGTLILNSSATVSSFSSTSNNSAADILQIPAGDTLTVNGSFLVGGINNNTVTTNGAIVYNGAVTATGGGNLVVAGTGNIMVGQTSNNKGGKDTTIVNLSALNSVNINTTGTVGVGLGQNSAGILTLADTTVSSVSPSNYISAAEIDVGNSQFNNDGGTSTLSLGSGSNALFANTINIGFGKTGGIINWTPDATSAASVSIAGTGGVGAANITLGQANAATYTAGRLSQLLLAGHPANVQAGTLIISDATGNTLNGPNSLVTFDTGTFTAQSVTIAADTGGTSIVGPTGALVVGGANPNTTATGVFTVGSSQNPGTFQLGDNTNTGLSATAVASLTINSGTANIYAPITVTGSANSTLTLAGNAVLNMEGNSIGSGTPISNIQLAPNSTDNPTLENLAGSGINGAGLTMNGAGTLILNGTNTYTGKTTVASGTLLVAANGALPANANVTVSGGALRLGASTGLATLASLAISGAGVFDVNNNHILINYGSDPDPIASIAALLKTGFAGGAWNGVGGIVSTAAAANSGIYALGYADSADPGNPAGLSSGTIEIKYTLLGDADLSGVVDGTDFGIVAANFNKGVSGWDQGDFNYDGVVDGSDFGDLAANFNKGASGAAVVAALDAFAAAHGLLADVPEPASASLLTMGTAAMLARRRRKSRS